MPPLENNTVASTSIPQQKAKKSLAARLMIPLLVIVLALAGYYLFGRISKENQATRIEDDKATIRSHVTDYLTVETNNYKYSELGGIYGLEVTVRNTTNYLIDNATIRVTYIKKNGEVWRNHDVDFQLMQPYSNMTMKIGDTERGTSVKVRVISVKSNDLGLQ